ncbi:YhgE/Pip domain-containing protein [Halobacillus faecis]|uniref:Uncharacterized protein n=1 Tax=Halobacillus faecis TaxID=360184 RepID=A0A511WUQ5_9BACI|nr:YhgE/Pip domain-containing protein [Halobacillus faecis]GEN53052.1 hypothetical protein HFA01_13140 [Halobacillus faecis]
MNGWKLWISEWKHIGKNKKVLVPFLAVLLIPLIYSAMFLWAFWNPYDSMDELPVAIVNLDEGAEFNGEPLQVGKEFVNQLNDGGDFEYHVVSEEKGYEGLEEQDYYMLVEIPENFSADATTVMDDTPKPLQLKYVPNEGFNFLSAQIGESATEKMKAKLSSEMTETYANAMFEQFSELQKGLADASEKAGNLDQGAADLDQGAKKLEESLKTFTDKQLELASGTQTLRNGASDLSVGSSELRDGLGKLQEGFAQLEKGTADAEGGAENLQNGIAQSKEGVESLSEGIYLMIEKTSPLKSGAEKLKESMNGVNEGADQVHTSAQQVAEGITSLKKELVPLVETMPEEQQKALIQKIEGLEAGAGKLAEGASSLHSATARVSEATGPLNGKVEELLKAQTQLQKGADTLVAGQSDLYDGAVKLSDGQEKLKTSMGRFSQELSKAQEGAVKVASGASEINQGASRIFDGSNQLADGSKQLQEGAGELSEGTGALTSGTQEFESNLSTASSEANEVKADEETGEMMGSPVGVDKESLNHVPNYGTGFTPYFLSLGLFVGALLITIVYPVREPFGSPRSGLGWFSAKFGVLFVAGTIQAVIAASVILYGLNLEVTHVGYFYLFSILTSLTFMTLVQMLVTWLGDPGRFVAILILILQLTTSAGTFPLELIPGPLQWFNPLLPMTYSVAGFKSIISDGNFALMWQNASILTGFIFGASILTIIYFIRKNRKQNVSLQEEAA